MFESNGIRVSQVSIVVKTVARIERVVSSVNCVDLGQCLSRLFKNPFLWMWEGGREGLEEGVLKLPSERESQSQPLPPTKYSSGQPTRTQFNVCETERQ